MDVFFLREHMSEFIASFFLVFGGLMSWTFIHKKADLFTSIWQKRMIAAFMMFAVTMIGMFSGLVLAGGHSVGNPTVSLALGVEHTHKMFTNESNFSIIWIIYIAFQLLGASLAFVIYIIYIWIFNFTKRDFSKHIYITKIFNFDSTQKINIFAKDSLGSLILVFVSIAGASLSRIPTGVPESDAQIFIAAFITSIAIAFVIITFGLRAIITLNPLTWLFAFILKLVPALYLNKKLVTWKLVGRELMSPLVVLLTAAISGLTISGLLSLPFSEGVQ